MTKDEALKQALSDAKRKERHFTVAETRYWLEQYKLIAEQALNDASHLAAPVQPAEELERERALELSRAYQEGYERAIQNITPPAAPMQEPVGWWDAKLGFFEEKHFDQLQPVYTTPPAAQREWVNLTDEQLRQVWYDDALVEGGTYIDKLRQVEAKLKEKNNG